MIWLLACQPKSFTPDPVKQVGQVTLTVDASQQTARLRVLAYEAFGAPLPSERQGLPLDACATLVPVSSVQGLVFRDVEVRAWCDGVELELNEHAPGSWAKRLPTYPDPGLLCRVSIDGEEVDLPALPESPDVTVHPTRLTWTPAGADEIRVSVPRSQGRNTLCRLVDDGSGPRPQGINLQTSFVSRVELAAPAVEGGRLPMASISGAWLPPRE